MYDQKDVPETNSTRFCRGQPVEECCLAVILSVPFWNSIFHVGNNHWVCAILVGCVRGNVSIHDSLLYPLIWPEVKDCWQTIVSVPMSICPFLLQTNLSGCGVLAIAFASSLVLGNHSGLTTFETPSMRKHLVSCVRNEHVSTFPMF